MSTYARIKQTVTTRQAAERYGLSVNRSGMARCPFHEDHNPSMKVDDRFYCFGCHASGDVIDFTARLFGLSPYAAAKKLEGRCGTETEFAVHKRETGPLHRVKRPVQVQFKYGEFRRNKSARKNV